MAKSSEIFNDFNLSITPESFFIQPSASKELLIVDRLSETVTLTTNSGQIPASSSNKAFCGLLGCIQLLSGKYLILATEREFIGLIAGHAVWRLTGTEILPYRQSELHLTQTELADNSSYLNMIKQVLNTPYLYFSYSYDLTHTMQRLHVSGPSFLQHSLLDRADERFVWNNYVLKNFCPDSVNVKNFLLPLLHGFISINQLSINSCNFTWAIISRRSIYRSGTRLFRRGIDKFGNVANFVETEQIVEYQGSRASFVQVRGSIPLFWSQFPDLRYKPPPQVQDFSIEEHQAACAKHLDNIVLLYGRQVLIDLVDQRGAEGKLQSTYNNVVQRLSNPSVRYEPFDFHFECRHMRWDRLSILLDRVAFEQDEMGYFLLLRDGSLALMQDGVFRTNCVDCLDRTNVVQSMFAQRCLTNMLRQLSIIKSNETVDDYPMLGLVFKGVWADNADLISIQYSGTGALKTDFTRTGKRTYFGLIRDGINSITRFYKNNFCDGFRQDSLDLFHGQAVIKSPLYIDRGWRYVTFPSVLLIAVAMFVACAVLPPEHSTESLLFILFWGTMIFATLKHILRHGVEYIDKPRLLDP